MAAAVAAPAAAGSRDVEFIRARSDKREYRRVVLPNALEILLISDPDTDKVRPRPAVAASAMRGMLARWLITRDFGVRLLTPPPCLSLCAGGGVHGGRGGLVQRPGGARGPRAFPR
jgi:hypothetical protein